MSERAMNNSLTNILTILAGLYTVAMSYASSIAITFVTWTSVAAILGALAAVIGAGKALYEWGRAIRRAAIEEAEHQLRLRHARYEQLEHEARMRLITGASDEPR